ncbi:MAG TPA: glycosyltransferase family 2 protein [Methylomirabilota bacterium]|nr:glycosyltransferase family 2 protein [Methylomirabilota bacterium]
MSPGDPAVAIVLVTYFGADNLDRLYASVQALRYRSERQSLIVVENGPDRDAWRWFRARAPQVRVLVPGDNIGYAGGAAAGMREALAAGVDYVAVITQDTVLDPDWLRELVAIAERHPQAGAVQPKILRTDRNGRMVINTWGNELHFLGVGFSGGDGRPDGPLEPRPVGYASGAGVLFRASALRTVGLFDPAFFMYHEDSDLSWRMRLAGYDVLLAPRARMHHDYDFGRNPDKLYYIERNRLINVLTHYRLSTLALLAPALLLFEVLMLGYAFTGGWLGRRLAVYRFFMRRSTWQYLRQKRRAVQSIRRVPDRAITVHWTARIEFPAVDSWLLRRVMNPLLRGYWLLARPLLRW